MLYEQLNKTREELQDFVQNLERCDSVGKDDLQAWKNKLREIELQCQRLQHLPEEMDAIEDAIIDQQVKERAGRRYDGNSTC